MAGMKFSVELRSGTDVLWNAIQNHPFVQGIGRGDLDKDRWIYYLKQDYFYLIEMARSFGLALTKAEQFAEMRFFAELLEAMIKIEMDIHRRNCAEFGITEADLERTQPSLINVAYTNHLIRTAYEGRLADILTASMPCAGYVEIAERLKGKGLPDEPHYRNWIETYASPEFKAMVEWMKNTLDDLAAPAPAADRNRWSRIYLTSTRFELLFFDMSWNREEWPAIVPRLKE